jgi:hypothetical protein
MYDVVCPMHETRFSIAHKLITIVTVMSVLGGMVSVVACFALVLVGKSSMVPIFFWRVCLIAFLVVLVGFLSTFWVMMAGDGGISFVLYLLLVWLVELGSIVSGALAFSGAVRYSVLALLALCLVMVNWLFPVLRFSPQLVFITFKSWRSQNSFNTDLKDS